MDVVSGRDIALTGVPRGGTTLACRLLGDCELAVSLFEPMEVMTLPAHDRAAALDVVAGFYRSSRASLQATGCAPSKQAGGAVPDNPFGAPDADGRRPQVAAPGWIEVAPPPPGFTLAIKHNAAFAALLPELADRFDTYAIIRNPVAALGSWASVDLPVSQGRVPAGERLDPALAARLDACADLPMRQVRLIDWFFERFTALPDAKVLRYEDIVASDGRALFDATGLAPRTLPRLESRNASRLYPLDRCRAAVEALLAHDGAWRRWYDEGALRDTARRWESP